MAALFTSSWCTLAGLLVLISETASVTPVMKVVTLLEDMKSQVEAEGKKEAGTYETFACFCKSSTGTKSTAITTSKDRIEELSGTIQADTALKATKASELRKRSADHESDAAELQQETVRCASEIAEAEAKLSDLTKAVSSLGNAVKAMKTSQPSATSLLSVRESVGDSLMLADALSLITAPKHKTMDAFLQQTVDPSDPEYKYHSQGIIDTLESLLAEFTKTKTDTASELAKTRNSCDQIKKSLTEQMKTNTAAMDTLKGEISNLQAKVAQSREALVQQDGQLKDDQLYLKDLTERCEQRAKEWDQRSQMRADELTALTQALAILKDKVSKLDTAVNKRALLIIKKMPKVMLRAVNTTNRSVINVSTRKTGMFFFQSSSKAAKTKSFLQRTLSKKQLKLDQAVQVLQEEGQRLDSKMLSSLALQVTADPFDKVKTLIQQLIERLLQEATSEATKKGFCDEKVGMANQSKNFRFADVTSLLAELDGLQSKKDDLEAAIPELENSISSLRAALNTSSVDRAAQKADNLNTLTQAKEGLEAVSEAITILKDFYKQAAKAQMLVQASPIDQDNPGAGFDGAYAGKQEGSKGVIGLLETIKSDFERTVRTTRTSEKDAAAAFVKFDRVSKADISGKETSVQLSKEELETTKNLFEQKTTELSNQQTLLDSALKELEDLKPMCIDTGMSFAERTAKRDEEIAALRKALCILDTNGVETECGGGSQIKTKEQAKFGTMGALPEPPMTLSEPGMTLTEPGMQPLTEPGMQPLTEPMP